MFRRRLSAAASRTLPVIDIAPLIAAQGSSIPTPAEQAVATQIDAASKMYGFFHISGHGVPDSKLSSVLSASQLFFALPVESKLAVRAGAGEGTGWEPSGAQNLDEGRLGEGIDGAATMEKGDVKESYILGRPATAQLPPGAAAWVAEVLGRTHPP